ncbi:hypothetical protein BJ742DRAFT_793731 [Cladochytrium replicatum]|nr:hypothetical protein BJ742DRAFT_793731 [Cladochytrium replicatum]
MPSTCRISKNTGQKNAFEIFNATEMREHLLMQLREVFDPVEVPEPIDVVYWIWNDGATHLQLPHSGVSMDRLEEWGTTAPIAGEAVYMIGEAYGSSKGWMEPALESAALAVDHFKGNPRTRATKSDNDMERWPTSL